MQIPLRLSVQELFSNDSIISSNNEILNRKYPFPKKDTETKHKSCPSSIRYCRNHVCYSAKRLEQKAQKLLPNNKRIDRPHKASKIRFAREIAKS